MYWKRPYGMGLFAGHEPSVRKHSAAIFEHHADTTFTPGPMKTTILLLAAIIGTINAYAQQAVPASGGNATGSGGTASYTVGQVGYVTASGAGGTSQQGV